MPVEKLLLTYTEVAELLGVKKHQVHQWVYQGKIAKVSGTNYISRAELDRFAMVKDEPKPPEERRRGPQARTRAAS